MECVPSPVKQRSDGRKPNQDFGRRNAERREDDLIPNQWNTGSGRTTGVACRGVDWGAAVVAWIPWGFTPILRADFWLRTPVFWA